MRRVKTDANEAIIIILLALSVAWVVCSVICLLKGKYVTARSGLAFGGAMRLAHPKSYYAYWFYRRNLRKYWRAIERFGLLSRRIQNVNFTRAEAGAVLRIIDCPIFLWKHRLNAGRFKSLPATSVWSEFNYRHGGSSLALDK